jgi:DNA-binding NarL/FixJ family response regulator
VVTYGVLVVDDDPDVCTVVRRYIERERGLRVCGVAVDPDSAIELARATDPDVVVLDYDLGRGASGPDLALRLRDVVPGSHIVLFSAYLRQSDRFAGVDAVHEKDRLAELAAAIRRIVGLESPGHGPTIACPGEGCTTRIPLAYVDVVDEVRSVTCDACGATRRWSVPA